MNTSPKRKIYVFCNSCDVAGEWHSIVAIADDGHGIGFHACSNHCFIEHDMGFTSDWKHDGYNDHFGVDGWELEYVERSDVKNHEGLQKALTLNRQLAAEAKGNP